MAICRPFFVDFSCNAVKEGVGGVVVLQGPLKLVPHEGPLEADDLWIPLVHPSSNLYGLVSAKGHAYLYVFPAKQSKLNDRKHNFQNLFWLVFGNIAIKICILRSPK